MATHAKNRPREIGDIPCGRELNINLAVNLSGGFEDALRSARQYRAYQKEVDYLFESMRVAIHHQYETITILTHSQFGQHTNKALRVSLLLKRTSEEEFKREIQKRDKANAKKNELLQVVITFRDALTDLVWPFVQSQRNVNVEQWLQLVVEIKTLVTYVDECFDKIASVYGSVKYQIMTDRAIR